MSKVTLVIDRSQWGVGHDGGLLLDPYNNRKCCLGFAAEQLGFQEEEINGIGMPDCIRDGDPGEFVDISDRPLFKALLWLDEVEGVGNTDLAIKAACINDQLRVNDNDETSPELTLAERERMLTDLFAAEGIELQFTGEYGTPTRNNVKRLEE